MKNYSDLRFSFDERLMFDTRLGKSKILVNGMDLNTKEELKRALPTNDILI